MILEILAIFLVFLVIQCANMISRHRSGVGKTCSTTFQSQVG